MIAAIVTEETYQMLEEINRRNQFELCRLAVQSATQAQRQLEKSKQTYTHILIEVDYIRHGNVEAAIDLIERLQITTTAKLLVLLAGYDPEGGVAKDLVSIGIEREKIVTQTGLWMKKRIQELLSEPPLEDSDEAGTICPDPAQEDVAPEQVELPELPKERAAPELPSVAPAQVDRATAKKQLLPKPPISQPRPKAITVAFAGAGSRMGTTTQAMQMFLFLVASGYKAALIEMSDRSVLSEFTDFPETCPEHYRVRGLEFFRTRNSLLHAKNEYQYLVLDYGNFAFVPDLTSFMEKDFKIICTGVKPQESARLATAFEIDDGSCMYAFTFVPSVDEPEVRNLMRGHKIYFAPYAPDYWSYAGDDAVYRNLLDLGNEPQGKPGFSIFKKK